MFNNLIILCNTCFVNFCQYLHVVVVLLLLLFFCARKNKRWLICIFKVYLRFDVCVHMHIEKEHFLSTFFLIPHLLLSIIVIWDDELMVETGARSRSTGRSTWCPLTSVTLTAAARVSKTSTTLFMFTTPRKNAL